MGRAWPQMRTLDLCPDPLHDVERGTRTELSILDAFAQAFANLDELAVYIDSVSRPSQQQCLAPFPRLTTLHLGTSLADAVIDFPRDVARYVGLILPTNVVIQSGRTRAHRRAVRETKSAIAVYTRRTKIWSDVIVENVAIIHAGMKVREAEISDLRRRNAALEREVQRLSAL